MPDNNPATIDHCPTLSELVTGILYASHPFHNHRTIGHEYLSNGLNLLHPRKDVAEMVIVFCVSLIVPEDLMFAIKSGEHVYQESSFFVSPLSFLRVSWWYQVSMSWCNCSKMSEVLAGAHFILALFRNFAKPVQDPMQPIKSTSPTSWAPPRRKRVLHRDVQLQWVHPPP